MTPRQRNSFSSNIAVIAISLIDSFKTRCKPLLRMFPKSAQKIVYDNLFRLVVHKLPDRAYLQDYIFPALKSMGFTKILSVGVESYNDGAPNEFTEPGVEYWTLDINPDNAKWGSPGKHVVGDALRLHELFEPYVFDCVIFNGVIGFGINDKQSAEQALEAIAAVLRPCGWLVLGWNVDKGVLASELSNAARLFRPLESSVLPPRITFDRSTHRFDFLMRRA